MKYVFSLWVLFFTFSCAKSNFPKGTPNCIQDKIQEMEKLGDATCSVYRYTNQGTEVYLVYPGCCDQFEVLYDSGCNYICAPSGGFTGKGDGKCNNLELQNKTLIWKAK
ncbi:MAG: hypothetical protein WC044_10520 [Crocinitomicaceae bacterium]